MKMWKIQEEAKAKVMMVFAEITQEGTEHNTYKCFHDGRTCMCVAYGKRSMFEKAHDICRGCNPPDVIIRSMAIMVPERCWVFDSVSAEKGQGICAGQVLGRCEIGYMKMPSLVERSKLRSNSMLSSALFAYIVSYGGENCKRKDSS